MGNRVAILIDGAFFLKRFNTNNQRMPRIADMQPFINDIMQMVNNNPTKANDTLLRTYYYDCRPFGETKTDPKGNVVNFSQKPAFAAANLFHNDLKAFPQLALRLGELSFDGWKVDPENSASFKPDFKQKAVDMKIGLDIAWMAGKRTIDKLVLVAGDSDFVSPMEFARKEGILVYLYPMKQLQIKSVLKEHADFVL
ncbi:NYN domain-containing protein [Asinibacterium sp. OR53]|uniref:NYN domain-containing protein n=1 Tax=Asinibacterium sp. OR53 TaxID=925409 RepID=UPI000688A9AC|nr:NYN domain-containing protein [Asinibacterium sp. OR53]